MKRRAVFGALMLAPFALSMSAAAANRVPAGTVVQLRFDREVSTKTAKVGDVIPMRVYADVVVNGKTLIKQDAPATGVVTQVKKPGRFGKRGSLKMRLESVKDVNGGRVPLDPYTSGSRFKAEGPGASAGGLLILGPVGLVGGAFIKGSHITVDKGTRIQAEVAGAKKDDGKQSIRDKDMPPLDLPDRNTTGIETQPKR